MKKLTRKQKITSVAVLAVLVVGGGTGVAVHQSNAHAQQIAAQKAQDKAKEAKIKAQALAEKKAEAQVEADATKALLTAEKAPSAKNIKFASQAIEKVKDANKAKTFKEQLDGINARVKLENAAKTAVSAYQKSATDNAKYEVAKSAVNKLTSPYSKGLKDSLNKQIAASKAQADQATKAAKEQVKAPADNTQTSTDHSVNTDNSALSNTNNSVSSGSGNTPSGNTTTNTVNTNGGSNSGAQTPAPSSPTPQQPTPSAPPTNPTPPTTPVADTFNAWVKNKSGAVVWSQSFSTWGDATSAISAWINSQYASGNFDIGASGIN